MDDRLIVIAVCIFGNMLCTFILLNALMGPRCRHPRLVVLSAIAAMIFSLIPAVGLIGRILRDLQ